MQYNISPDTGGFPPNASSSLGADEELLQIALSAVARKYGGAIPRPVEDRILSEYESIASCPFYAEAFLAARRLMLATFKPPAVIMSCGHEGASAVAYYLGLTGIDPLAPHYYCSTSGCGHFKFNTAAGIVCGSDLPPAACPACSVPLASDGYGIPFESYLLNDDPRRGLTMFFTANAIAFNALRSVASQIFEDADISFGSDPDGRMYEGHNGVTFDNDRSRSSLSVVFESLTIDLKKYCGITVPGAAPKIKIVMDVALPDPGAEILAARRDSLSWPVPKHLFKADLFDIITDCNVLYWLRPEESRLADLGRMISLLGKRYRSTDDSSSCFIFRDEVYEFLAGRGVDSTTAISISEQVRKGKGANLASEKIAALDAAGCPPGMLDTFAAIKYLPSKAVVVSAALRELYRMLAWQAKNPPGK